MAYIDACGKMLADLGRLQQVCENVRLANWPVVKSSLHSSAAQTWTMIICIMNGAEY
jgi:hypothetical protein